MSEHEPQRDGEVFYEVEFGPDRLEATTENTSVWQHIGELAIYNCVIVDHHVITPDHRQYKELTYRAILNECERHMALRSVRRAFVVGFDILNLGDLHDTDGVPLEWLDEQDNDDGDSEAEG